MRIVIDIDSTVNNPELNYALIEKFKKDIYVPLTILYGAGSFADIQSLISKYGIIGSAAGSLFVFKGKYRAVLISYPSHTEKEAIFNSEFGK